MSAGRAPDTIAQTPLWRRRRRELLRIEVIAMTREAIVVGGRLGEGLIRGCRPDNKPGSRDEPTDYFFRLPRYATSASTSSLGNVYAFIAGSRVACVFAVIPFASTIQARISSVFNLLPTSSSGPFALPFPAIE